MKFLYKTVSNTAKYDTVMIIQMHYNSVLTDVPPQALSKQTNILVPRKLHFKPTNEETLTNLILRIYFLERQYLSSVAHVSRNHEMHLRDAAAVCAAPSRTFCAKLEISVEINSYDTLPALHMSDFR